MMTSNLIPRIGERIEQLNTAIFFGPPRIWRYPACIIRHIKVHPTGNHLWFRMKNISLNDEPGQKAPAYLFCYNKRLNFYITVEGDAVISGLAGDLKTPEGWQDPIYAHQMTYLIRMEVRHASTFYRPALANAAPRTAASTSQQSARIATIFPDRPYTPPVFAKKQPKFHWSAFF